MSVHVDGRLASVSTGGRIAPNAETEKRQGEGVRRERMAHQNNDIVGQHAIDADPRPGRGGGGVDDASPAGGSFPLARSTAMTRRAAAGEDRLLLQDGAVTCSRATRAIP